eukprot:jgi/Mesen1/733/ME000011S00067
MKSTGHAAGRDSADDHTHRKNVQKGAERQERHSAAGLKNDPKKGGSGGKYNWGAPGQEEDYVEVLDKNDPNYDEDEGLVPGIEGSRGNRVDSSPKVVKKVLVDQAE